MAMYSLTKHSKIGFMLNVVVLAVTCMIAFPLLLEQVSHRVGPLYLNIGTGMISFFAQMVAAIMI